MSGVCEGACVISVQMVAGHQDIEEHRLEGVVTEAALGTKYENERGWIVCVWVGGWGEREREKYRRFKMIIIYLCI